MPYILPKGTYYDASPHVAAASIECAVRPSNYVLTDGWQTDPMDVDVCWRPKTQLEIDAEIQAQEDEMAFPDVLKTIAKALHNHENRIRAIEGSPAVTLRQVVKALREL